MQADDRGVAWIRGAHNGGTIPVRHFLSATRVINDTYGLFFYDPDGGYVTAYKKDYGHEFHGWRLGVMIVKGRDGTLWSALSGRAIAGPQTGARLTRVPNVMTDWSHWLMLHPESTAYDLFDGKKYEVKELPTAISDEAKQSMGQVDDRLKPLASVPPISPQQILQQPLAPDRCQCSEQPRTLGGLRRQSRCQRESHHENKPGSPKRIDDAGVATCEALRPHPIGRPQSRNTATNDRDLHFAGTPASVPLPQRCTVSPLRSRTNTSSPQTAMCAQVGESLT